MSYARTLAATRTSLRHAHALPRPRADAASGAPYRDDPPAYVARCTRVPGATNTRAPHSLAHELFRRHRAEPAVRPERRGRRCAREVEPREQPRREHAPHATHAAQPRPRGMPPDQRLHLRAHLALLLPRGGVEPAEHRHRPAAGLADLAQQRVHVRGGVQSTDSSQRASRPWRIARSCSPYRIRSRCARSYPDAASCSRGSAGDASRADGVVAFHHDRIPRRRLDSSIETTSER